MPVCTVSVLTTSPGLTCLRAGLSFLRGLGACFARSSGCCSAESTSTWVSLLLMFSFVTLIHVTSLHLLVQQLMSMSRIPQPSSSRRPSKTNPSSAPTTQTRPRVLNSITSTPTYVQSTKTARDGSSISTSPATLKPNISTVRRTGSTVSLKVKAPATPRPQSGSPAKAKPSTSTNVNSHVVPGKTPTTPSMSVREAIALKRAEVKKAQEKSSGRGGFDAMSSLQDALPPHADPAQQEEDLLGRATLRETIDKARSTGEYMLPFLFDSNAQGFATRFTQPGYTFLKVSTIGLVSSSSECYAGTVGICC